MFTLKIQIAHYKCISKFLVHISISRPGLYLSNYIKKGVKQSCDDSLLKISLRLGRIGSEIKLWNKSSLV